MGEEWEARKEKEKAKRKRCDPSTEFCCVFVGGGSGSTVHDFNFEDKLLPLKRPMGIN